MWLQGFNKKLELLALILNFTLMANVFIWQMKTILVVTHFSLWRLVLLNYWQIFCKQETLKGDSNLHGNGQEPGLCITLA